MKFKLIVADADRPEYAWRETEDRDLGSETPEEYGRRIIDRFNSTLREGEKPRVFLGVEIIDVNSFKEHNFRKTNMTTIIGTHVLKGKVYDTVKCERCGITGKRFGLSDTIKYDAAFRAKVYDRCDTSIAHLEIRKRKNND